MQSLFLHACISAAASSSAVPPISPIRTIPKMQVIQAALVEDYDITCLQGTY